MSLARRPFLAFAAFAALALLPAAQRAAAAETLVKGSGIATTQRRDIGAFVGVGLGAPFAVVRRPGPREAIEIVTDDNIMALVHTFVEGAGSNRTLQIDLPRDTRIEPRTPVVVTIDYVRLEDLAVGGSGSITGRSMKAPGSRRRSAARERSTSPTSTPTSSRLRSAAAARSAPMERRARSR